MAVLGTEGRVRRVPTDLRWMDAVGLHERPVADLTALLERDDGFVWLDVPLWDDDAEAVLSGAFDFHPDGARSWA